jgi:hypothetical protein
MALPLEIAEDFVPEEIKRSKGAPFLNCGALHMATGHYRPQGDGQ